MANLLASLNGLPAVVKVGWIVWMAWGTAQVLWYRRARLATAPLASAPATHAGPASAPGRRQRPVVPRPVASVEIDSVIIPATGTGSVLGLY